MRKIRSIVNDAIAYDNAGEKEMNLIHIYNNMYDIITLQLGNVLKLTSRTFYVKILLLFFCFDEEQDKVSCSFTLSIRMYTYMWRMSIYLVHLMTQKWL